MPEPQKWGDEAALDFSWHGPRSHLSWSQASSFQLLKRSQKVPCWGLVFIRGHCKFHIQQVVIKRQVCVRNQGCRTRGVWMTWPCTGLGGPEHPQATGTGASSPLLSFRRMRQWMCRAHVVQLAGCERSAAATCPLELHILQAAPCNKQILGQSS